MIQVGPTDLRLDVHDRIKPRYGQNRAWLRVCRPRTSSLSPLRVRALFAISSFSRPGRVDVIDLAQVNYQALGSAARQRLVIACCNSWTFMRSSSPPTANAISSGVSVMETIIEPPLPSRSHFMGMMPRRTYSTPLIIKLSRISS